MYETEFKEAELRSKRLGLSTPNITFTEDRYFTQKAESELHYFIRDKIGVLDEDEIVHQCLSLHIRLKSIMSEYFNCPAYLTIGYVEIDGNSIFKQDEDSLKAMMENGISGASVSLHAWLTLPSMEILDYSLATSYGRVKGDQNMMGRALALHTSQLTGGMRYRPMLIGEDFLLKTGAMKFNINLGD